MTRYRARTGLQYRPHGTGEYVMLEAGSEATDLPPHGTGGCGQGCAMEGAHDWLVADGVVELVNGSAKARRKQAAPEDPEAA